jgi:hypothetical protein
MGCQTTNTPPPKDTTVPKKEQPTKVVPTQKSQEKAEHQKKMAPRPGVVTTVKPLMCGDPTTTLNAVTKHANEYPLAIWKDASTGYQVIMTVNKEKKTATILEYIPGPYACFLSVGVDVHVEGVDFPKKKTGISADRSLTKPLERVINKVQFGDTD